MKKLDYDLVGERLFSNYKVRARIERDYSLPTGAATSSQFLDYAVRYLDQEAMDNPPRSDVQQPAGLQSCSQRPRQQLPKLGEFRQGP